MIAGLFQTSRGDSCKPKRAQTLVASTLGCAFPDFFSQGLYIWWPDISCPFQLHETLQKARYQGWWRPFCCHRLSVFMKAFQAQLCLWFPFNSGGTTNKSWTTSCSSVKARWTPRKKVTSNPTNECSFPHCGLDIVWVLTARPPLANPFFGFKECMGKPSAMNQPNSG